MSVCFKRENFRQKNKISSNERLFRAETCAHCNRDGLRSSQKRMKKVIAGIDIGGTKTAIALENSFGERVAVRTLPTRADAFEMIGQISDAIEAMLDENGAELTAVGIGCPSPLDIEKGLVMSPSNLREWNDFPIVKLFKNRFNVPVVLENDANTAALGEYIYGAGRGYKNIVYVTVSTGIGGGIILNGEIFHGTNAGAGRTRTHDCSARRISLQLRLGWLCRNDLRGRSHRPPRTGKISGRRSKSDE